MTDVKLLCAVYGEASVFPVTIALDEDVIALQKKVASAYKTMSNRVPVCPATLTLYVAKKKKSKKGKKWMKCDSSLMTFLKEGRQIDSKYLQMIPTWKLKKPELFGESFQPGEDEIHVLVELPSKRLEVPEEEDGVAKKKLRLMWQSTQREVHDYDPNSEYFLLKEQDVDESGLPPVRTMLYCRPLFHRQFEFLRDEVLTNCRLGWILGPPGTGKSSTAMAFASTLKKSEWVVTWIHVKEDEVLTFEDTRPHFVVVDGWTTSHDSSDLSGKCIDWFKDGDRAGKQRRLAFVCAVAVRGGNDDSHDFETHPKDFRVWSWTLEEYQNAIKNEEVFKNVSQILDAPAVLPDQATPREMREAKVESKYYYAGGSCRYMFHYNTADVKKK